MRVPLKRSYINGMQSDEVEIALLSQEGSMIETKSRSCGGWFQSGTLKNGPFGTTPRGIRFAIPLPS